jgi:CRP-like cAMP-binding protein
MTEAKTINAGDFLVQENELCKGIYIINEGQLEVFKSSVDGKSRIPLAVIGSGEFVGEIALFLNGRHTTTVQAMTAVKYIEIPKEKIESQLASSPAWMPTISSKD